MQETESNLRELYERFSRGDLPGVLALCTDDISFELPGKSLLPARTNRDSFGPELVGKVMQLSGGSFREEVIDILAGETHAAAYLTHSFEREGRPHSYRTIHLWGVREGKFSSWREFPEDQYQFDAAWS
jgi:ketosteroid isomerase-like protein